MLLLRFALPAAIPEATLWGMLGLLVGSLGIVVWWAFFSRAPRWERVGAIALMIAAIAVTRPLLHESIATGHMGAMFFFYGVPSVCLGLVVWAVAARSLVGWPRWATLAAVITIASGAWTLLRTDGITGDGDAQLAWRWSPTHEDRLLARAAAAPEPEPARREAATKATPDPPVPAAAKRMEATPVTAPSKTTAPKDEPEWPGFRGPARDGVVRGLSIETDWARTPPVELWRRPVGPAWSSVAVQGDRVYTQEQRGGDEVAACYELATGEPVWMHKDSTRFWESNAGAGPRATPTVEGARVYTMGATGVINALDARDGSVKWSRNAAADTGAKVPDWGFSGSPLVVGDAAIIAASGMLAAYDAASGALRWSYRTGSGSYGSPHLVSIGGVRQVVLLNGAGAVGVAPTDGKLLWQSAWEGFASLQPAIAGEGALLFSTSGAAGGFGIRRIEVSQGTGGWTVAERWTSTGLKPYFNDFVVHKGHAYGFDGRILSSINLSDGKRNWKGGRYGNGQLVLLADQDLLLVVAEEGEVALVRAAPEEHSEVARFQAIEGKTWNHPAVAGDILLVRNGEEMAAFRLRRTGR
jgi:outer membrane protein assembly factor BamB